MVDLITLYSPVTKPIYSSSNPGSGACFKGTRLGVLPDFVSAKVTETLNGTFTFSGEYAITGSNVENIVVGNLIECYANTKRGSGIYPQLFRITGTKRTISNRLKVDAEHISYDLSKYIVEPVGAYYEQDPHTGEVTPLRRTLTGVMEYITGAVDPDFYQTNVFGYKMDAEDPVMLFPFTFHTVASQSGEGSDYGNVVKEINFTAIASVREWIGKQDTGVLSVYGGELSYSNEKVIFNYHRGGASNVRVLYGKNLKDFSHDIDGTTEYQGFFPYYELTSSDGLNRKSSWYFEESEYQRGDPNYCEVIDPAWGFLTDFGINAPIVSVGNEIGTPPINESMVVKADLTSVIDTLIDACHNSPPAWPFSWGTSHSWPSKWSQICNTSNDYPTPDTDEAKATREHKRQFRAWFIACAADAYAKAYSFDPKSTITVDFQSLYSPENSGTAEQIELGDTVSINYHQISNTTYVKRVIELTYNVLNGRYEKLTLGDKTETLATLVSNSSIASKNEAETTTSKSSSFESDVKKIIDSYGGTISGSGTTNNLVKWTGTSSVGNSGITIDAENRVTFPGTITANPNPGQNSSISNYILGTRMIKQDITSNNVSNKYVTMLPYNVDHSYIGNQSYPWERGYITNIISGLSATSFDGANDSIGCWDSSGYLKKRTFSSFKNEIIPAVSSSTRNKVLKHVYDDSDQPVIDEVAWAEDKDTTYSLSVNGTGANVNKLGLTAGGSGSGTNWVTVPYATKALNDAGGSQIDSYYAHGLNISGHTISLADGNGEEISGSSVTVPDNNTTYSLSVNGTGANVDKLGLTAGGSGSGTDWVTIPYATRAGSATTAGSASQADILYDPDGEAPVSAGSSTEPVYFTGGLPSQCTGLSMNLISKANVSTLLTKLDTASANATSGDYIIAQDNGGQDTYYRRPLNKVISGVLGYSQSGTNFPVQMSSGNKLYVSVPSASSNPIKVGSRVVTAGNTVVLAEGNGMNIQLQESGSTSTITFTVTSVPCVIEGTPIRLANGVDIPVEELQNGDEILSWDPNTEQFTTAVVCVVRNTGKDKEFVDHIFDDGSHLTTFGEHVVYNKTKGYPMDISKFEPGDTTVNVNGEVITYCGSLRHYCRERRMAHYDISSSNNLYFAGGILNGKMQFAKFRAMDDIHMELTPEVQAVFDIHKAENAKDLGYENNDEYYKQIAAEFKEQMALKKKIADAKQKLADSDYLVQKFTENLLTLSEWAKAKTNRANWRTIINDSEALLKPVEERINAIKSKFATRRNNKRTRFNQQCQIDNEHFADYKAMFKKGETDEK